MLIANARMDQGVGWMHEKNGRRNPCFDLPLSAPSSSALKDDEAWMTLMMVYTGFMLSTLHMLQRTPSPLNHALVWNHGPLNIHERLLTEVERREMLIKYKQMDFQFDYSQRIAINDGNIK